MLFGFSGIMSIAWAIELNPEAIIENKDLDVVGRALNRGEDSDVIGVRLLFVSIEDAQFKSEVLCVMLSDVGSIWGEGPDRVLLSPMAGKSFFILISDASEHISGLLGRDGFSIEDLNDYAGRISIRESILKRHETLYGSESVARIRRVISSLDASDREVPEDPVLPESQRPRASSEAMPVPQTPEPMKSPEAGPTPVEESPISIRWPVVVVVIVAALGLLWVLLKKRK